MRAVIQRVRRGSVSVDGQQIAQIGRGLVILLGVGAQDSDKQAVALARKIALHLSIQEVKGSAIVVSQFTLYADTRKGRRPSFTEAAKPDLAEPLVHIFAEELERWEVATQEGVFGAHMVVDITNDGPVTIVLDLPLT